jgi:hypothetical protein
MVVANFIAKASLVLSVTFMFAGPVVAADQNDQLLVGPDQIITGAINGQPTRYRMMASGTSTLILNPASIERLRIKPSWLPITIRTDVGPVTMNGHMATITYGVEMQKIKRRVFWFARSPVPDVDGVLGPAAVPDKIVTFNLRPPVSAQKQFILPLVDRGYEGMGTTMKVGGETIFVQWNLTRAITVATAAAGVALANQQDGQLSGPITRTLIAFEVERPVRTLMLKSPLVIGPLQFSQVATRIADYGDASGIADANADPSEITVVAKNSKKKGSIEHSITVGQEAMAHCSSLTFDKGRMQIILACLAR